MIVILHKTIGMLCDIIMLIVSLGQESTGRTGASPGGQTSPKRSNGAVVAIITVGVEMWISE